MPASWRTRLINLFFPEWARNGEPTGSDPLELLEAARARMLQLADQLEAHAAQAPYPHVAAELRRIADEKREEARIFGSIVEKKLGWVPAPETHPRSGKNHWERIRRDLEDQAALDDFLAGLELKLSGESSEIISVLASVKRTQVSHRRVLTRLLATADPLASQT